MADDPRSGKALGMFAPGVRPSHDYEQPEGRWPANVIHDGSDVVDMRFDEADTHPAGAARPRQEHRGDFGIGSHDHGGRLRLGDHRFGDSGSPARFFYEVKEDAE